jgi:ABC-type bacteriocin/lantibiotic exporter with double-glycine peptidase domain
MHGLEVKTSPLLSRVLLPSLLINILSLAVPLTVLQIYDRILPNQSYGTAILLIAGASLAVVMESFLRFVRAWLLAAAAGNTEQSTYKILLQKLRAVSPQQLRTVGVGGVQEGLNSVGKVKEWYSGGLVAGFIDFPFAIIFLGLVYYIGGVLVLVPLVVWLITLMVVLFTSFKVKSVSEQAANDELQRRAFLGLLISTLQGIKRQAVESRIYQQFKARNHQRYASKTAEEQKNAFAQECIQLAALATSVILVIIGSLWVLSGELTTGGLAACSILSGRAVAPLSALMGIRIKLNTIHAAKHSIEALNQLESIQVPLPISEDFSRITLTDITASHYQKDFTLNTEVTRGEIVLINSEQVHTDSYMLANLAGVDELSAGKIKIDGQDTSFTSFNTSIAFCPAKGQLIAGSILDNLCGFNVENTTRAIDYAQQLGLDSVVTKLSEGLETKIGHSHSYPFSMGSIKRIALVTQFARGLPIVMLDRPDVSLDIESINKLALTLQSEAALGRTIFIVSYHPQLVALATKTIQVNEKMASVTL